MSSDALYLRREGLASDFSNAERSEAFQAMEDTVATYYGRRGDYTYVDAARYVIAIYATTETIGQLAKTSLIHHYRPPLDEMFDAGVELLKDKESAPALPPPDWDAAMNYIFCHLGKIKPGFYKTTQHETQSTGLAILRGMDRGQITFVGRQAVADQPAANGAEL